MESTSCFSFKIQTEYCEYCSLLFNVVFGPLENIVSSGTVVLYGSSIPSSFCFGATPRNAQEILLDLHSEITHNGDQGPYRMLRTELGLAIYKASVLLLYYLSGPYLYHSHQQ